MSQLKITSAGIAYKNDVFAGTETLNITKMVFAHVPGLNADSPILSDSVPANIVHNQPIDRVSSLDGDAVVISSVLGYDVGNFTFNWFGAIAKKANGTEVLIAIVHTNEQTKTRTDGANTGDYSVKSIIWRSQQLAGTLNVTLPTLPWQVNEGVFATKSDIESLEQYIKDAGLGTQISHQSANFFDRTFEFWLGAGESKPFPDLPDSACDILIFGLTDGTVLSTNFVGRFTKYGSTWSANTIYGNTSGANHPSIEIIDNVPTFRNHHGFNSYPFAFKCWIATQSGGNAKPFEFFANTYSTYNKPTPADIGAVAKGESINLTDQDIIWSNNSDGAKIGFKNDADSDADSYLFFETSDNSNEYFKWRHRSGTSYSEWMSLRKYGLSTRNATFDNGTNTTVNIQADSGGRAILNVCSEASQSTGTVYVGQTPFHGGGIEYNGDNSPVTTGAGADFFTLFRRENGTEYWTARNFVSSNDWEFRAKVKAPTFEENGTLLSAKYHPKSTKLASYESSFFNAAGQDLRIRDKRALVGAIDKLYINYGTDWQRVYAQGDWNFGGDITITKNNPWLTLKSNTEGSVNDEQAAGISIGESGRSSAAALHISYTGDGLSYIGMGLLGSDNIPNNWAMKMDWTSTWVCFRSEIRFGDYKTKLSKGYSDSLRVVTPHGNADIGPKNQDWCHFDTSNPKFYFGKPVHVKGEIYAGPSFNQRVYHEGHKPTANDVGAIEQHWGTTSAVNQNEFTTIAKISGHDLASSITLQLKGTVNSTVVNVKAEILVDHHKGILVDAVNGGYTALQIRIISNGNEKYLVQVKTLSGNPIALICNIQSHTNDSVSIGNYSTDGFTVEHIHTTKRNKRSLSSINGTNIYVDNYEVLHSGNVDEYLVGERKKPLVSGVIPAHSNVHLKTSETFILPPVAETPEDAVIVVSKRLSATPLIKTNSQEKIIMTRRGRAIEKSEVLFDANCTLTFILNDEGHWEMHI
ncbi:phage tail protein [Pseudoalteromonas sp. GCY]|uniref:phage tail-collar fiber domain-containing protein n=1 Tax=Pseudoalteromonas sp. GCY TaxID=2003316 RepID=UPI001916CC7E|nr:phage tail protein [Pseudoalteromonas sp. GCY]QQQ65637.1 phage tail protein [Pseudoalteromonas sp. GCY]